MKIAWMNFIVRIVSVILVAKDLKIVNPRHPIVIHKLADAWENVNKMRIVWTHPIPIAVPKDCVKSHV